MPKKPSFEETGKRVQELDLSEFEQEKANEALPESEEQYKLMFDNAPISYQSLDNNGCILDVNKTWLDSLGYQRNEVIGVWFGEFLHHDQKEIFRKLFPANIQSREPIYGVEFTLKRKDGSFIVAEYTARIGRDADGRFVRTHCVFQDITERKRVEEALRESEEKMRNIVEYSSNLFYSHTAEHEVIYMSPQCREFLQCEPEEAMVRWTEFVTDNPINERGFRLTEKAIKTGKRQLPYELELMGAKGRKIWVEVRETPIFEGGKTLTIVGSLTDITQRKQAEEALRESHQIIEGILNAIPARVFWKDQNLIYLGCNKLFARDAGFDDPKDMIGKDDYQMGWRDQAELYRDDDLEVIKSGNSKFLIEEPQTTPEGNTITLLTSKIPLRTAAGEIIGVLGTYLDITDRKQAEKALQKSEERYRTILTNINDGYFEVDIAGNFTFSNDSMCKILGYPNDELVGINNREYMDEENAKKVFNAFNRVYKTGQPYKGFDWELIRKNGSKCYVETSIALKRDSKGQPIGFQGIARDITERKQVEEKLRESDERYRRLFNHSREMVYLYDFEGDFIDANDAALEELGYTKKDLKSLNFTSLLDMDQLPGAFEGVEEILKNGSQENITEFKLKRKDGELVYIESKGVLIYRDGNPVAIQGIARNITQRKILEEEREKLINELQQALKEVKQLSGFLPICSHCKKIRDDKGYWNQIEAYIQDHSEAEFSHGICQECAKKYYPEMDIYGDEQTQ